MVEFTTKRGEGKMQASPKENKSIKLLHINGNYIYTNLHRLMAQHLTANGCQNLIYVPTYDKSLCVVKLDDNVVLSECFKKWDRLFFGYKQKKIISDIQKKIDVSSFELIHAYTLFTDGNSAMELAEKYGVPYVVTIRNVDVNSFYKYRPYLKGRGLKIMLNARAVFFLSESYRQLVLEKYVPEKYKEAIYKKSYIMPNGIDDFWHENQLTEEKIIPAKEIKLIYAGRIDKNKNIPTTQKAIDILNQRGYNASLTVVGKIADDEEFKKIIVNKHTAYVEAKPKEELIKLYREHDIFVMPSYTETFGLVYAEAMSQGLPVIYTRGQGFDGQFDDGEVGFSVNADSPEEIADKIEKILENYELISKRCPELSRKFNWNTIVEKYGEIYKSIL